MSLGNGRNFAVTAGGKSFIFGPCVLMRADTGVGCCSSRKLSPTCGRSGVRGDNFSVPCTVLNFANGTFSQIAFGLSVGTTKGKKGVLRRT